MNYKLKIKNTSLNYKLDSSKEFLLMRCIAKMVFLQVDDGLTKITAQNNRNWIDGCTAQIFLI